MDNYKSKKEIDNLSKQVDLQKLAKTTYSYHQLFAEYVQVSCTILELMTGMLYIHPKMYSIGGSWAMVGYGIELPRKPHDVDIIVDSKLLMTIDHIVSVTDGLSIGDRESNSRYARMTLKYKGLNIDILGTDNPDFVTVPGLNGNMYQLDNLYHIIDTKKKWARPKDVDDIHFINKFLGECS